jgi:hypothetical protein
MSDVPPVMHQEWCLPGCLSAHSDAPEEDDAGCADCRGVYGHDYIRIHDDEATLDGTYDKAQLLHIASHLTGDDPPVASKLDVKPGDTIVFIGLDESQTEAVRRLYHEKGKDGVFIISMPDGIPVESMDEYSMRRAGWVRAPRALADKRE